MLRNNLICTMYNRKRNIIKILSDFIKEEDGIGVVEIILILVGNFTPYLGCVLCG